MANANDQLVVAYFPNRGAAEATAEDLKDWDKANDSIKLGHPDPEPQPQERAD